MGLAMKLGQFIEAHGWSIQQLADRIGVTHEAARKYIREERIPRRKVMGKISEVTSGQVQPNDFFSAEGFDPDPEPATKASTAEAGE